MQEHENYCNDCQGCLTPGCYGACDCQPSDETVQTLIEDSLVEEFGPLPSHDIVDAFGDLAEGRSIFYDNDEDFLASLDTGCRCGRDSADLLLEGKLASLVRDCARLQAALVVLQGRNSYLADILLQEAELVQGEIMALVVERYGE